MWTPHNPLGRRRLLLGSMIASVGGLGPRRLAAQATQSAFAPVLPNVPLAFPRDHGAHPEFRIEWWYLTGWLRPAGGREDQAFGLQITFFRARTGHPLDNPSRFSPAQLLFAHAAIAEPGRGRLLHLEQAARPGFGLAEAGIDDTALRLGRWSLMRDREDGYRAQIAGRGLVLDLRFTPPGPPILQGDRGFSAKGPKPEQASYYYSRPWLATTGWVNGRAVQGTSWFDHEWSSQLLDPEAQGWDWAGLHLDDGRALMVFQIRSRQANRLWTQSRWIEQHDPSLGRAPDTAKAPAETVEFVPIRQWQSPRTGVRWPVAMTVRVGGFSVQLEPLLDDQELDSRATTGVLYWEGAVRVLDERGTVIGRGYLELTGYGEALRL